MSISHCNKSLLKVFLTCKVTYFILTKKSVEKGGDFSPGSSSTFCRVEFSSWCIYNVDINSNPCNTCREIRTFFVALHTFGKQLKMHSFPNSRTKGSTLSFQTNRFSILQKVSLQHLQFNSQCTEFSVHGLCRCTVLQYSVYSNQSIHYSVYTGSYVLFSVKLHSYTMHAPAYIAQVKTVIAQAKASIAQAKALPMSKFSLPRPFCYITFTSMVESLDSSSITAVINHVSQITSFICISALLCSNLFMCFRNIFVSNKNIASQLLASLGIYIYFFILEVHYFFCI